MYQFCTQVSGKERLPAMETILNLGLCHFLWPSYVSPRVTGREKREKAHVSTCTGSYYTRCVIITAHLHHVWEDWSIFNQWAEKHLSELINQTWQRQREPVWKATISNGRQTGGTRARSNLYQMQSPKKRETCLWVTREETEWELQGAPSLQRRFHDCWLTPLPFKKYLFIWLHWVLVVACEI